MLHRHCSRTPGCGQTWLTWQHGHCRSLAATSSCDVQLQEGELTSNGKTGHRLRRNVTIRGRRTSVSLEGHMWEGLLEICRREATGIDALCTAVDARRGRSSLSSALRVFLLLYFRSVADQLSRRPAGSRHDGGGFLERSLDEFSAAKQAEEAA